MRAHSLALGAAVDSPYSSVREHPVEGGSYDIRWSPSGGPLDHEQCKRDHGMPATRIRAERRPSVRNCRDFTTSLRQRPAFA
jgi:hypothetical protein